MVRVLVSSVVDRFDVSTWFILVYIFLPVKERGFALLLVSPTDLHFHTSFNVAASKGFVSALFSYKQNSRAKIPL